MKIQKPVIFVKNNLKINMRMMKNIIKLEGNIYTEKHRGAAHSIFDLKHDVPKKIHIAFHNGSNYDYHFIMKELAKEFENNLIVYEKTRKNT